MEIARWLQRLLPKVESFGWREGCWVAHIKARTAEHHPPLHWLGRALDTVAESDAPGGGASALDRIRSRLLAVHGAETCEGWSDEDQRAQDVLTEACAYAWASQRLGPAQFVEANGGERLLVHVPSLDAYVAPRRLWPVRTLEALLEQVGSHAAGAAVELPEARGRIVYVDLNLALDAYARDVGYDGPMTEPVRQWVKHHGAEQRLGWVLTRPFEWGVPLEAWY